MKLHSIVALGDSITKGVVLENDRYCVLRDNFVEQCRDYLQADIINLGRMGCTVTRGADILEQHARRIAAADLTLIEFGGNDSDFDWQAIALSPDGLHSPKTGLAMFHQAYSRLIGRVRELGSRPVLLSLPLICGEAFMGYVTRGMSAEARCNVYQWLGGHTDRVRNYHDMYNLEIFRLGSRLRVPVLDITTPFLVDSDYTRYLCSDGIHPNQAGHYLIADTLKRYAQAS